MAKKESRRPGDARPVRETERVRSSEMLTEEEAARLEERRRAHRKAKMKEKMLREKRRREITIITVFLLFCVALLTVVIILVKNKNNSSKNPSGKTPAAEDTADTGKRDETPSPSKDAVNPDDTSPESGDTEEAPSDGETDNENPETPEESEYLTITEPTDGTDPIVPEGYFAIGHVATQTLIDIPVPSWVTEEYISFSEKTRPNQYLDELQNIVVHYVGNPGSTAEGNREYFESLSQKPEEKGASSHYIVGLEGEIIQCIPIYEVAFANYPRNNVTISIEVCHPDEGGQFNQTTYWSLVRLCAYLLEQTGMTKEHLIRHYDVSGKECPVYYVQHPEAWTEFKEAVGRYMAEHPDIRNEMP